MEFYLGTTNMGKAREIEAILEAKKCMLKLTDRLDPEETESTFEGNARLKARVYAKHAGGLTISEDSGLRLLALNGLPGPWSARFSDCQFDVKTGKILAHHPSNRPRTEMDRINNELVLKLLEGNAQRRAEFVVALAVADSDGNILFEATERSTGWIATEMRGTNGFAYDPIFVGDDTTPYTYAEVDSKVKNAHSHRRKVLDDFEVWLEQYLQNQAG